MARVDGVESEAERRERKQGRHHEGPVPNVPDTPIWLYAALYCGVAGVALIGIVIWRVIG